MPKKLRTSPSFDGADMVDIAFTLAGSADIPSLEKLNP